MLFVGERRRSRWLPGAIRSERSEQLNNGLSLPGTEFALWHSS